MERKMKRKVLWWVVLLAAFFVLGCGGSNSDTPSLNDVTIAISPTSVSLAPSGTQVFSATVSNAVDPSVTWTATGGTITTAGVYTAPATAGTYTVKATSNQDTKVFASATVTVTSGGSGSGITVTLSSTEITVPPSGTRTFSATVTGTTDTSVAWTCSGGSINQLGEYTAPDIAGTYAVTAQSKADRTKIASCRVNVGTSGALVSIYPTGISIGTNETQPFTATVTGLTDQRVTWSATGGTITSSGSYTAPSAPGSYVVTATSVADTARSASATVTVNPVAVSVVPPTFTLAPGGTKALTASVTGPKDKSVYWTASAGTITSAGVFTAPSTEGTVTIFARSNGDPNVTGTATVSVVKGTDRTWDFQSGVPSEWAPITPGTAPSGQKFLGRLGQGATAGLTLSGLSAHTSITVTYDLYVIGRWTGDADTDTVQVKLDGTQVNKYSFSNTKDKVQSYPTASSAPGQGALSTNALGYTFSPSIQYNDAIYRITFTVDHTSNNLYLAFIGNPRLSLDETSWGIDNVTVTANP